MLALRVHGHGPGESVRLNELPLPRPAADEVRVRVQASGISFVDLLVARGAYPLQRPLPFVPGSKFSGMVDALGSHVDSALKVGDRVAPTF